MKVSRICTYATAIALFLPSAAMAQETSDLSGSQAVQAVYDGDAAAFAGLVGQRIELADPLLTRPLGVLTPRQVVDMLQDCEADIRAGLFGVGSFRAEFDCSSTGTAPSLPDCATEDWILDVAPMRGTDRSTILFAKRSNEGECYRPPIAPPAPPRRSES